MLRTRFYLPRIRLCFLATAAAVVCMDALAQTDADSASATVAQVDAAASHAGSAYPLLLDNTLSVLGDMEDDDTTHNGFLRLPSLMDPWFAWKRTFQQNTGLSIGGSYQVLWQNYSSSLLNEHNSVGGKLTVNLSYPLLNAGRPDALTFDVAIEDRRPIGTSLAPLQAGLSTGSMVPTAATYGQFDLGISQAYIRQNLFDNRFQYTVGKIFAPNFIDAYPFFDDNRQFLSQAFSTSPTIASPLRGFGAVAAWYPTETGLYVKPGVFTTHSDDTGSTVGDFFNKNENFYMLEAGWSGLARSGVPIQARGPMDSDNIHLTGWYRDPQEGGTARAYGAAFNANYMYGDNLMWFTRAGWSSGWFIDRAVSVGIGWRPTDHFADLFGVAVGWVSPSNSTLRTQNISEIFYRYQLTSNLAITPDLQFIQRPPLSPGRSELWVLSVRARMTF